MIRCARVIEKRPNGQLGLKDSLVLFADLILHRRDGTLAVMRVTVWAFALCFGAITVVSWRYLFILPIVFSIVITVCLTAAAWLSAKPI